MRAISIEAKVSSLYSKISNPVLANLKLTVEGADIRLSEVYPQQLPDLFHSSQLVVFGRYSGKGHAALKLSGNVGAESKDFVYEMSFAEKTNDDKAFVEDLWARRKVGFLLDQIRLNGDKKELVEEVVTLARRYGITTPYTSYLVVPDSVPVANGPARQPGPRADDHGKPNVQFHLPGAGAGARAPEPRGEAGGYSGTGGPAATALTDGSGKKRTVAEAAKDLQTKGGEAGQNRVSQINREMEKAERDLREAKNGAKSKEDFDRVAAAGMDLAQLKAGYEVQKQAGDELRRGGFRNTQEGTLGVNLSVNTAQLRTQQCLTQTATRWTGTRNCLEIGGIWIDETYKADMKTLAVKAQSPAYFRMLERRPELRKVFTIGNHVVWVSPSGTALIIDPENGADELTDAAIEVLFVAAAPR